MWVDSTRIDSYRSLLTIDLSSTITFEDLPVDLWVAIRNHACLVTPLWAVCWAWQRDIWEGKAAKHLQRVYTREQTLLAPYSWPVGGKKTGSWLRCSLKAIETLPLASTMACRIGLLYHDSWDHSETIRNGTPRLKSTSATVTRASPNLAFQAGTAKPKPLICLVFLFWFLLYNMWLVLGGKCKQMEHTCMIWIGIIPQWSTVSTVRLQVMLFGIDRLQRNYGLPNRKP